MTKNEKLLEWVKEWEELCQPEAIHWCDGSEEENQLLLDAVVKNGKLSNLTNKRPGSYYFKLIR